MESNRIEIRSRCNKKCLGPVKVNGRRAVRKGEMGKSKLPIVWVDGRCVFFVGWLVYEIITARDKEKAAMQTDMSLDIHMYVVHTRIEMI